MGGRRPHLCPALPLGRSTAREHAGTRAGPPGRVGALPPAPAGRRCGETYASSASRPRWRRSSPSAVFLAYLWDNLTANQRALGIDTSFDFLDQQAGFPIAYTDFSPSDTVLAAILTGLRNTIAVALFGIVLTLIFGTLIGIARLSGNWVVAGAAGVYVEVLRNVPPLLVIVFVNSAALASLPPIDDANDLGGVLLLSVRQVGVASRGATGSAGSTWSCSPRPRPRASSWPGGGCGARRPPGAPGGAGRGAPGSPP